MKICRKGLHKPLQHKDGRDFERGAYSTFQYVVGQIKSVRRKTRKSDSQDKPE